MTITFPLAQPTINVPVRVNWSLMDAVGVGESPYTFTQEVYEHAGKRLAFDAQLPPMDRSEAVEWMAFLASLRGRRGTFYFSPPAEEAGRGALSGSPLVKGASQTGNSLLIDGCGGMVSGWIKKGDWIQLGSGSSSHLHMSLTDQNSDSSGEVTLDLWPGPRTAPADNEAVVVSSPKGVFRLASNKRGWDIGLAQFYGLSFSAVEAL